MADSESKKERVWTHKFWSMQSYYWHPRRTWVRARQSKIPMTWSLSVAMKHILWNTLGSLPKMASCCIPRDKAHTVLRYLSSINQNICLVHLTQVFSMLFIFKPILSINVNCVFNSWQLPAKTWWLTWSLSQDFTQIFWEGQFPGSAFNLYTS